MSGKTCCTACSVNTHKTQRNAKQLQCILWKFGATSCKDVYVCTFLYIYKPVLSIDLYQETVRRFTRSSLSPTSDWDRFSPARRSLKSEAGSRASCKLLARHRHCASRMYL